MFSWVYKCLYYLRLSPIGDIIFIFLNVLSVYLELKTQFNIATSLESGQISISGSQGHTMHHFFSFSILFTLVAIHQNTFRVMQFLYSGARFGFLFLMNVVLICNKHN